MPKKALFIMNPKAGKTVMKDHIYNVIREFTKADYRVTVYPTSQPFDARHCVIKEADDYDMVICSGGDGTLDDTISGYMMSDCKKPQGYIPTGSTNDFARSLGIPLEIMPAVNSIISGSPFDIDIGSLNDKDYFVYVAAFGIFTEVSYDTNQRAKNMFGYAAYVLRAIKSLNQVETYHATIHYGNKTIEDTFIYAMITNSLSVGGLRNVILSDYVEFDDGEFECLLIKAPKNLIELQEIVNSLMLSEVNVDYMYSFKASSLHITFDSEIPWTTDGEYGGAYKEVEITNHRKAVPIIL